MKVNKKKNYIVPLPVLLFCLLVLCLLPVDKASAEEATVISIGKIDYENLTIQMYNNNNTTIYYSSDKNTWTEVEGPYNSTTNSILMDISWVSSASDVTLYFKGNTVQTIISVTLPMQNKSIKVTYDKVDGRFTFSNTDEADTFQWRKSTDYSWTTVEMDETAPSYITFIDTIETFLVKGAKIYIRIPQIIGTDNSNEGCRPSKEVSVSITKRSNAPSIKVNISKLTLNTTEAMEYYDTATSLWIECNKSMSLDDIAPNVLYKNGSKNVTFMIRTAATSSLPYSKTAYITINGQEAAPVIGGSSDDVTYYYMNSKLVVQFPTASNTNNYEYAIIKSGFAFNASSASWKTVTSSKSMTILKTSAPEGCKIYVRKKGINENTSKNISFMLPSAESFFTVKYPVIVQPK